MEQHVLQQQLQTWLTMQQQQLLQAHINAVDV